MKKRNIISCFIALLFLPTVSMGQWQANMINSISGGEKHYKVHYTATDGRLSSMNDPVQAYNNYKTQFPC